MNPIDSKMLPDGQLMRVVEIRPGRFQLLLRCDRSPEGACRFPVHKAAPIEKSAAHARTWAWDGVPDTPTITPSINCHGGCGRHWVIVAGRVVT